MFTGRPLDPYNPIVNALLTITEPILAPVRRFTTFGMMDFSPIVVLLTLTIVAPRARRVGLTAAALHRALYTGG